MGVGAAVVQHHMQLPPRVGLDHQLEEGEELGVAVPWEALVGTRPVAASNAANRVVVPCLVKSWVRRSGPPRRSGRLGAVRESAWIWRGLSREGLRQASSLG
jgi:hypothetical protein